MNHGEQRVIQHIGSCDYNPSIRGEEEEMEFNIENVEDGNEYRRFRSRLEGISGRVNVSYNYIAKTVKIGYEEPYLIDNEVLKHKSNTKKEILAEIRFLRRIQFTNSTYY